MTMKLNVVGFEISEGISGKTGKPYAIGKLYCLFPLAGTAKPGNVARGAMSKEFRCEVPVLRKIEHIACPCVLDAEMAEVMRFGELSQDIVSLKPLNGQSAQVLAKAV
jgi:hypothetical protein